jgi:hypothetical protein
LEKERNMKLKSLVAILFAIALLLGVNGKASAGETWYPATVLHAGTSSGYVILYLSSTPTTTFTGTFTPSPRWFQANTTDAKQIQATALTAMSLGKKVRVYANFNTSPPTILGFAIFEE